MIQKGVLFRKEVEVPAQRVVHVEEAPEKERAGTVVVQVNRRETEEMSAQGAETLSAPLDMLGQVEEFLPTGEGLRRRGRHQQKLVREQTAPALHSWWRILGPGFLSGMAGNDASAVGTYSINGARVGLAHLWLLLLATPLYQAVQYSCAKIGRATGKGLASALLIYGLLTGKAGSS